MGGKMCIANIQQKSEKCNVKEKRKGTNSQQGKDGVLAVGTTTAIVREPKGFLATTILSVVCGMKTMAVRALIDGTAPCNFISKTAVRRMGLLKGISPRLDSEIEMNISVITDNGGDNFQFKAFVKDKIELNDAITDAVQTKGIMPFMALANDNPDFIYNSKCHIILQKSVYDELCVQEFCYGKDDKIIAQWSSLGWMAFLT